MRFRKKQNIRNSNNSKLFESELCKPADFHLPLLRAKRLEAAPDAGMSLRQDEVQPLDQTVIIEVHFRSEWGGGFHTDFEEHIFAACLSERSKKHTGRQEEVQGIDGAQRAHPEVFKIKHLLFAAEVFFNSPTEKVVPHSGNRKILGVGAEIRCPSRRRHVMIYEKCTAKSQLLAALPYIFCRFISLRAREAPSLRE